MNVSLPISAANATPPKTLLPGTGATPGKFSGVFAEAQGSPDPSLADIMSDDGKQVEKKISAKSEKDGTKPSRTSAELTVANPLIEGTALSNSTRSSWSVAGQKENLEVREPAASAGDFATLKSGSAAMGFSVRYAMTESGVVPGIAATAKSTDNQSKAPIASSQPEPGKTDPLNPAEHNQSTALSSTNLLNTWTGRPEGASFKPLIASASTNLETSVTPNGKPATAGSKTASGDTVRSTTSTLDAKGQPGLTFSKSQTDAAATPSTPIVPSIPNVETKHEIQSRSFNGGPTSKQEKAAQSSSEANKKQFDGTRDEPAQSGKGKPSAVEAAPASRNADDGPATPGSAAPMAIPSPAAQDHSSSSPKTSFASPHGQSPKAAEDMEATGEATVHSASLPLHAAKLVASMERSELRVGLRAGEFGNVDIRTSLARNQFTAEISVERGELGRALAAELPSLHHRLSEQHLSAANITVQDNSGGSSADFQRGSRQSHTTATANTASSRDHQDSTLPAIASEAREQTARLDIHM